MNTNNKVEFITANSSWLSPNNWSVPNTSLTFTPIRPTNVLLVYDADQKEIIKIAADGRIFWEGREVTTDEDYREAMMVLVKRLTTRW